MKSICGRTIEEDTGIVTKTSRAFVQHRLSVVNLLAWTILLVARDPFGASCCVQSTVLVFIITALSNVLSLLEV